MGSSVRRLTRVSSVCLFLTAASIPLWCQAAPSELASPRIIQAVDETNLTRLRGNTHPMARPEFDRGVAPASLPMKRMLLVLQRSPEQESALRTLLDDQQDKSSLNYHRWLTPEEFGRKFGPADQDIQVVTGWLRSHGFEVARVSKGRTVIEFSGTAGQVQEAFHTAIHKYVVKGEEHWANSRDPQIPTALTPVVAGVHTLHNFYKKPQLVLTGQKIKAKYTPNTTPKVTFPGQNGQPALHALAPADYATIYNINPLYNNGINGAGTTIAVVARSDLFSGGGDIFDFHNVFGVSGIGSLNTINDGPDPGDLGGGDEVEATLDATWSSSLAPGANVDFVVSASTDTTDGVDLSELYIIDNNLASVMTESFGDCEQHFTSTQLTNVGSLAEQAAAQGITYLVASGDSGAEGCDDPNAVTVAVGPLAVSGLASTPFNVAVGGTMFNENGNDSTYWNAPSPNNGLAATAKSYIPENVWNDSCTSAQCGAANANIFASGGGVSTAFSRPSWQAGVPGIPGGSSRLIPDVSLTASGHDFYLLCIEASCQPDAQGFISLFGVAGTSASTPSFAAIMALVNQRTMSSANPTGRQGQADYVLYRLAAMENLEQCNASKTTTLPSGACVFNDVTVGNNAVPGEVSYGTATPSYQSTVGYDLATGLGSVNVTNLVNSWQSIGFTPTTTQIVNLNPTTLTHGQPVNVTVTVTGQGGTPTGTVALLNSQAASYTYSPASIGIFPLSGGSFSGAINTFPGTVSTPYTVTARYSGDGTFAPSISPPSNPLSISAEPSTTALAVLTLGPNFTFQPFSSGPYGSFVYLRADVKSSSGFGIPEGEIEFFDGGNLILNPPGLFFLNSEGNTATPNYLNSPFGHGVTGLFSFATGQHSITADYSGGDGSFQPSNSSPVNFTIQQAPTTTSVAATGAPQGATLTATVSTNSGGNAPSGNVTFSINGTPVGSPVQISQSTLPTTNPQTGTLIGVQGIATLPDTVLKNGTLYTLTASYAGDSNYLQSTSPVTTFTLKSDFVLTANGNVINIASAGGSGSLTLNLAGNDGFNGTVQFNCSGLPAESNCAFSPNTIALSGTTTSAITTLTVTITGPHQVSELESPSRIWAWSIGGSFSLAGIFLVGMPRKPRIGGRLLLLVVFALLLAIVGCGGGGGGSSSPQPHTDPGTPTGSFPVTVTATSGALSHSVSFTLNTP